MDLADEVALEAVAAEDHGVGKFGSQGTDPSYGARGADVAGDRLGHVEALLTSGPG
jgi:hypothetical protein